MTAARWFGLLGGHVAWSAQLVLGYALLDAACPEAPAWGGAAVWALTLGLAGVTALAALASWRALRAGADGGEASQRDRFLGRVGLWLNGLYLFVLALSAAFLTGLGTCR